MAIKRCKSPFSVWKNGVPRVVSGGQLIEDTDPVYKGHEHLFEDVETYMSGRDSRMEQATADPGERRTLTPSPAVRDDQQADSGKAFDPDEHNAPEVLEYLKGADEEERARVLAAEAAGRKRKGILGDSVVQE